MTAENRLDTLLGALRRAEPQLDDLRRVRVGAELQAALREPPAPPARGAATASRTRLLVAAGGIGLAAAAAAWLAVVVAGSGPTREASTTPGVVEVLAGVTERVVIDSAEVTVYGPGRVTTHSRDPGAPADEQVAVVDADAVLVDRSHGDGALTLAYGDLDVRVMRATFALDRTVAPRVTVMRGELFLRCASGARAVRAGESATCIAPSAPPAPRPFPAAPAAIAPPVAPSTTATSPSVATTSARRADSLPLAAETDARRAPAAVADDTYADDTYADDTYAGADEAMRRGDRAAARTALEALVAAHPDARESAAALLDLARLYAPFDRETARAHLDALDAHPHGVALAEPAAHLRCALVAAKDRGGRITCLSAYYLRFPDAPRAAAVLARLAVLHAATDCATARPLLAEYLRRFPTGADRAAVTAWRDRCATP